MEKYQRSRRRALPSACCPGAQLLATQRLRNDARPGIPAPQTGNRRTYLHQYLQQRPCSYHEDILHPRALCLRLLRAFVPCRFLSRWMSLRVTWAKMSLGTWAHEHVQVPASRIPTRYSTGYYSSQASLWKYGTCRAPIVYYVFTSTKIMYSYSYGGTSTTSYRRSIRYARPIFSSGARVVGSSARPRPL